MKKIIALTIAMLLLLSLAGCGNKAAEAPAAEEPAAETPAPVETTPEPTPTPTPEPEWEPGVARAGYGELVYATLNRGDIVNVLGEWKYYYIIEGDEVDLLIGKSYLRLDSEADFEPWDGYARYGTKVFDNIYLMGEPIAQLHFNQSVKVLDGKDGWLYIEWEGGSGYVEEEYISRYPISVGGGGGDSGGGGGGGSSSSGGGGGGAVVGDINLGLVAYYGPSMEKEHKEMAMVLGDKLDAYLCITVRGDELKVTNVTDEECEIWMEGFTVTAPRWLMHMEGDEEYEPWTGYAHYHAPWYEEYQLRTMLKELSFNQEVKVIDEFPTCYVVEVDGQIGYMDLEDVSKYPISVGGGGGDSGGGGGGSSSGGGGGGWTDFIV